MAACTHCQSALPRDESIPVRIHARHANTTGAWNSSERQISLLHVELSPTAEAREGWRNAVQSALQPWEESLESTCGVICHSSEETIRALFNLYRPGAAAYEADTKAN